MQTTDEFTLNFFKEIAQLKAGQPPEMKMGTWLRERSRLRDNIYAHALDARPYELRRLIEAL